MQGRRKYVISKISSTNSDITLTMKSLYEKIRESEKNYDNTTTHYFDTKSIFSEKYFIGNEVKYRNTEKSRAKDGLEKDTEKKTITNAVNKDTLFIVWKYNNAIYIAHHFSSHENKKEFREIFKTSIKEVKLESCTPKSYFEQISNLDVITQIYAKLGSSKARDEIHQILSNDQTKFFEEFTKRETFNEKFKEKTWEEKMEISSNELLNFSKNYLTWLGGEKHTKKFLTKYIAKYKESNFRRINQVAILASLVPGALSCEIYGKKNNNNTLYLVDAAYCHEQESVIVIGKNSPDIEKFTSEITTILEGIDIFPKV